MLSTSTIVIGAFAGFVSLSIPTSSYAGDAVKTDPALIPCSSLGKLDAASLPNQTTVITSAKVRVEKGAGPDRIVAKARPSSPWPGRTRPLCAYPSQARYKGTGSIEDAANVVCR